MGDLVVVAREVLANGLRVGVVGRQLDLRGIVLLGAAGGERAMRVIGAELQVEGISLRHGIEELGELAEGKVAADEVFT